MKSVLYVAGALMVGASIYGFVSFNKASRQKEFKSMYEAPDPAPAEEKKVTPTVILATSVPDESLSTTIEQPVVETPKKFQRKRRTINYKSFSRAALKEKVEIVTPVIKETKTNEQ